MQAQIWRCPAVQYPLPPLQPECYAYKTLYTCYSYNDSCQCQNATVQLLQWPYLTLRHGYQVPLRSKNRNLKGPPVDEPGNREHEFPRIIFTTCSLGKSLMLGHILWRNGYCRDGERGLSFCSELAFASAYPIQCICQQSAPNIVTWYLSVGMFKAVSA